MSMYNALFFPSIAVCPGYYGLCYCCSGFVSEDSGTEVYEEDSVASYLLIVLNPRFAGKPSKAHCAVHDPQLLVFGSRHGQ